MSEQDIKPIKAGQLKEGHYILQNNDVFLVRGIEKSKSGKHGHAKCRIAAVGLIQDKKIIKIMPGHDKVEVPIVDKRGAQVLSTHGDKANVMDMESYETFEIDIPAEFKAQIKEGQELIYWVILDKKVIKQLKGLGYIE